MDPLSCVRPVDHIAMWHMKLYWWHVRARVCVHVHAATCQETQGHVERISLNVCSGADCCGDQSTHKGNKTPTANSHLGARGGVMHGGNRQAGGRCFLEEVASGHPAGQPGVCSIPHVQDSQGSAASHTSGTGRRGAGCSSRAAGSVSGQTGVGSFHTVVLHEVPG